MKNLLSSTAFLVVNKELAKQIGLNEVVLLADLISKEQYFIDNKQLNEGWFFNTAKNIQDDTTLTSHQQRKAVKNLKSLGIIETKLIGIPAKQHFKINENKLLSYFTTSYSKSEQQDVKKTQTINKNKEITINNNISIREKFVSEVMELDYPKELKIDFIEYWCEGTKNKMRWQKQPTFDISLRIKRWQRNQKKWNKGQSKIDSQINEYIKGKELLK
mgnify:FL=1|tara:strand:- start:32 stop:682 length:651 start_codon:yes stop_codon:yes gene_type:complete